MILNTFSNDTVSFWSDRGCVPLKRYSLRGFTTWELDVPEDHTDLRNPEYIGLQAKEIMTILPEVVRSRLTPPVYTLKIGKLFADVRDRNGKHGVPITHNKSILTQMCIQPLHVDTPNIVKLNSDSRIQDVVLKAQRQGTESILFFALPHVCETVPIEAALRVLKHF